MMNTKLENDTDVRSRGIDQEITEIFIDNIKNI